jgi:hypothetical protein
LLLAGIMKQRNEKRNEKAIGIIKTDDMDAQ